MSTPDVPGANPANRDELHVGCWAEHEDGSLIYVKGLEDAGQGRRVIYELFSPDGEHWTHFLEETKFKREFSWQPTGRSKIKWTWHDKSGFDWSRVYDYLGTPVPVKSAVATMSAASKVAKHLGLRAQELKREDIEHMVDRPSPKAGLRVMDKLRRALSELKR